MALFQSLKNKSEVKVTAGDVIREVPSAIKKLYSRFVGPSIDDSENKSFGQIAKEKRQKFRESFSDPKKLPEAAINLALSFGPSNLAKTENLITPVSKLIGAIKSAGAPRAELATAQTAERSSRAAKIEQVFSGNKGQEGYYEALGKLKGELTSKPKFQPLNVVKEQAPNTSLVPDTIHQNDVDELFNQIQASSKLDVFEKISASNGLNKLFSGELPPPSQLAHIEDVFGSDLVKTIMDKRGALVKFKEGIVDVLNVPRSLVTSVDMSAPLRQGVLLTVTKPKQSIPAFGKMFKDFFSEKNFNNWLADIPNNPKYRLMKDSKLYIADPRKVSGGLSAKEESFMSNLAEKFPVVGHLVKASSRAYIGYLNKLRVDVFSNMANRFEKDGATPEDFKSLANWINTATGRGGLGPFERVSSELNTAFFSPRLIASRFNLLNPVWYAKQTPMVRKEAIKSFAEFVGVGSSILAIAKAAGADVEVDPRSSDFGKIKVGNTRWDMWGGFQQWVRVFSQLASGQRKTSGGKVQDLSKKKFPFTSRLDVAETFAKGKLAPVPALITELAEGQKLFGEDITIPREIYENTVPLYLQDFDEVIKEFGPEAIFTVGAPAFFGVGTQTYKSSKGNLFNSFK